MFNEICWKIQVWLAGSPKGKDWRFGRIGEIAAWSVICWLLVTVVLSVIGPFSLLFPSVDALISIIWGLWVFITFAVAVSFVLLHKVTV